MTVEELREAGLTRMGDADIEEFLSSQNSCVLGLPGGEVPYLLPMSYGYDGGKSLYFTFVIGDRSQKAERTAQADQARVLVYSAPSPFQWQSTLLKGTIDRLPPDRWDEFAGVMENAWRPHLFERAGSAVDVYQFQIEEMSGYKHTGLPPGFEEE